MRLNLLYRSALIIAGAIYGAGLVAYMSTEVGVLYEVEPSHRSALIVADAIIQDLLHRCLLKWWGYEVG